MELIEPNPSIAMRLARAKAIDDYAMVEQQCSRLLSEVGKMEPGVASLIYFEVNNAVSRRKIISQLVERAVSNDYFPFWKSLRTRIQKLDEERNQIVHWIQKADLGSIPTDLERKFPVDSTLNPSNIWWPSEEAPKTILDVLNFADRCKIASICLGMFIAVIRNPSEEKLTSWRELCRAPIPNPIPTGHELYVEPSVWRK